MHNKKVASLILTPPELPYHAPSYTHTPTRRDREESPLSQLSVSTGWCCPAINDCHSETKNPKHQKKNRERKSTNDPPNKPQPATANTRVRPCTTGPSCHSFFISADHDHGPTRNPFARFEPRAASFHSNFLVFSAPARVCFQKSYLARRATRKAESRFCVLRWEARKAWPLAAYNSAPPACFLFFFFFGFC